MLFHQRGLLWLGSAVCYIIKCSDWPIVRVLYSRVCVLELDASYTGSWFIWDLSCDARKPVFGVSDQVQHKRACTVTEEG